MYAMQVVASTVFHLMMFTHEEKIVMVDQLTYHDPQGLTMPANIISTITTIELQGATVHANVIPATNTVVENTPVVRERNSYHLGYHNIQLDSRNQSFSICNRN